MTKIKILLLIILSFNYNAQITGRVISVADGDSITVLINGSIQKKLRLAEVDCPEMGQPFGKNAKQFTSSQVFGKNIIYYQTDIDRYGRIIAEVYYDSGKYLSEELIKSGFGWWYQKYSQNGKLGILEEIAKKKRIGLWIDENPIYPSEWRKIKNSKL